MHWFEEWFNSSLYEELYANRDEAEAKQLIKLLEKKLSQKRSSKILDLACGRGRHSINLAKKGYNVTGIDLSEQAIKTAKVKAKKQHLENVQFYVHDMREPLPKTFDAVVNLFTSFGYFKDDEENARVFDSVVNMLKPNGIFVIDYLNAEKVKGGFVPLENGSFKTIDYTIKRYIEDGAIHKDIVFKKGNKSKKYSERVKLYKLDWFKQQLAKRNLIIKNLYGDYSGNDFDVEDSPRMLIISKLQS